MEPTIPYRIDTDDARPPAKQLVDTVLDYVAGGALPPGSRLPSVRAMAAAVLVNPNTVAKAYRELALLDVVDGRNGSGVFVTDRGPEIARERRGDATLDAIRAAVRHALRFGHDAARIHDVVDQTLENATDRCPRRKVR